MSENNKNRAAHYQNAEPAPQRRTYEVEVSSSPPDEIESHLRRVESLRKSGAFDYPPQIEGGKQKPEK